MEGACASVLRVAFSAWDAAASGNQDRDDTATVRVDDALGNIANTFHVGPWTRLRRCRIVPSCADLCFEEGRPTFLRYFAREYLLGVLGNECSVLPTLLRLGLCLCLAASPQRRDGCCFRRHGCDEWACQAK